MSLACAVASLLAIVAASAITVAPGAEVHRGYGLLFASLCLCLWVGLAIWARSRRQTTPSPWLKGLLLGIGSLYLLAVLLFSLG